MDSQDPKSISGLPPCPPPPCILRAHTHHAPGGFERLELLQECRELLLLLLWRRRRRCQVPQSCLFSERALRELAAANGTVEMVGHRASAGPSPSPPQAPHTC